MMITYQPLMVTLAKNNIKKTELAKAIDISSVTLSKFAKNEYVKLEIIDRICSYLNCGIEDVVKHIIEE